MLLHELQHYKHKDALVNYITCIANVLYWFNPFLFPENDNSCCRRHELSEAAQSQIIIQRALGKWQDHTDLFCALMAGRRQCLESAFSSAPLFRRCRQQTETAGISDYPSKEIRYMLLHELQHYKHKDALVNYITCIAAAGSAGTAGAFCNARLIF